MDALINASGNDSDNLTQNPPWDVLGIGTRLGGSYLLVRRLAQGGMGDIYLAWHERLAGLFAIKVPSPILACYHDGLPRFQQEAAVMTTIRHPNVVQVVDYASTSQGMPYMVMEYLQGQDLGRVMAERELKPAEISRIVRKVACGLDAAHRMGIVHRDLKPENIMIVPCEGQPDIIKLIDFGICKARRFGHMTASSMLIGTPQFMSPEQAMGKQDDVDPRSDQFALAVVSYLMLTGHTPWGTSDPIEILDRVVSSSPLPIGTHVSSDWPNVESVLIRGMARAPEDRYLSALVFAQALNSAMIMDGLLTDPALESAPSPTRVNTGDFGGDPLASADVVDAVAPAVAPAVAVAPAPESRVSDAPVRGPANARCAARGRRRSRRSGTYLWRGTILFIAFLCGGSLGFLDPPTVRAEAIRRWDLVQEFVATTVTQSTRAAERGFSRGLSKVWKTSVDDVASTVGN